MQEWKCFDDNQLDEEIMKATKINFLISNRESFKELCVILSNAKYEFFFGFFTTLKIDFVGKAGGYLEFFVKSTSENLKIFSEFLEEINNTVEILNKNIYSESGDHQHKDILEYISKPIITKVLSDSIQFNKICEFSNNMGTFQNETEDLNFPRILIEIFYEENEVNYIKTLYEWLMKKKEYHKYISAVLCLKAFCFKGKFSDKNIISRILIEFLFLADVLKRELHKTGNVEEINKCREVYVNGLKAQIEFSNKKYADNTPVGYLGDSKVLKT
ncbi:hypothetical protein CWI38_0495p0020 [Hamiltosporidium tvaerminnensis]|uniref:Uncharacterized protein n=1 Tax=Hamiltosporidium tvaerminnensis TaxID=1176355 RepID=A0A4Q9L3R1_9MICR|nr:hypothetical protein LUQ84_002473 [Hamiltosporidium tvaerminnensis]TBU02127.1 hypothetical protein CWI37_0550p0020 [Hamiltosporidium tvaerminnensis]TBU13231.1 hypothetical protein CWI38_0495p0020 [Hamiltosporidium tvaerminnensis]